MTEQEISKAIKNVADIGGMTVNERLFVGGLMDDLTHPKAIQISAKRPQE
jgi:hypothetical protein